MLDRRKASRYKKRYSIKFGINKPLLSAFTVDISGHGLFIKTTVVAPAGTRLVIELTLPKKENVSIIGTVCWVCKDITAGRTGIGIIINRIVSGDALYRKHLAKLNSIETKQAIVYCAA
jgi:Tfp pilus assembly protein PilZ